MPATTYDYTLIILGSPFIYFPFIYFVNVSNILLGNYYTGKS